MASTPENFKPRQIADMTNTLANLQPGDQLSHTEIQLLAKINKDNVAAMRQSLEAEKNAIYPHYTSAENEEHKTYWNEKIIELNNMVAKYNGNLAKITLVATSDLALLMQAHKELEALKKSGDPVPALAVAPLAQAGVTTRPVVLAQTTIGEVTPMEVITPEQHQKIINTLKDTGNGVTATVRGNAEAIVSALKKGTKFSDVKIAIDSLLDKAQTVEQFQVLLGRRKDGTIGSRDILALLLKAGVDEKYIPQAIIQMAGKEGKKVEIKADAPIAGAKKIEVSDQAPKLTFNEKGLIMKGSELFTGSIDKNSPLSLGKGDTYYGDVKNGKYEGEGQYSWGDGGTYVGGFKNGIRTGQGVFVSKDLEETQKGTWKDGKLYTGIIGNKQGIVIEKFENGKKVELDSKEKGVLRNYKISDYLISQGFIKNTDGAYESKNKDLTFVIEDGKVDYKRSIKRAFGNWELNTTEIAHEAKIAQILAETN